MTLDLTAQAARTINHLCLELSNRAVGAPGNQAATAFLAKQFTAFGWQVECPKFDCLDWTCDQEASLAAGGETFTVFASPYSLGGRFSGPVFLPLIALEFAAHAFLHCSSHAGSSRR